MVQLRDLCKVMGTDFISFTKSFEQALSYDNLKQRS